MLTNIFMFITNIFSDCVKTKKRKKNIENVKDEYFWKRIDPSSKD